MNTPLRDLAFYSQQGEDIFIYKHFLNQYVEDGVFVEVGAYDGYSGSNTKFFEDNLGYTGVLIEPQRQFAGHIVATRPKSKLFPCAIHPTKSTVQLLGDNAAAGIEDLMSPSHKTTWFPDGRRPVDVPAFRLGDILELSNIHHVDFLSIDVEGGEYLVLESIHWSAVEIFILCIELDGSCVEKDNACRDLLRSQGFTFQQYLGNNDIWVNLSYSKKASRYGPITPYNAHFEFLNQQSIETLPRVLTEFVPPNFA